MAKGLVVGAFAGFGLFLGAGIASAQDATVATATPAPVVAAAPEAKAADATVQGSNSSEDAEASSGDAAVENEASVSAGPSAQGGQAQQIGDNNVTVRQVATARSGAAIAGSTVVGVVGGNATVQVQNSSEGAEATSGDVSVSNELELNVGPSAEDGSVQQVGNNSADVLQEAFGESGAAIAGSTVTGIVGDGNAVVQSSNSSEDDEAESGDVDVSNEAEIDVGPSAEDGQASQVGDNDAVLTQLVEGRSGDAVAGSTVAGALGNDATVQQQNSSEESEAESGDVTLENEAELAVGPSATNGGSQAQQVGSNSADVAQEIKGGSGDAVAGSQVAGLGGQQTGNLIAQNQNTSDEAEAESGDVDAENELELAVGPSADGDGAQVSQVGDDDVAVDQLIEVDSGDALAGSTAFGATGGDATLQGSNSSEEAEASTGDVDASNEAEIAVGPSADADGDTAQAQQFGDNTADVAQELVVGSGDAAAGSTIAGSLDGDATLQFQNSSEESEAESGDVDAENELELEVGPAADSTGGGNASAQQTGDNSSNIAQVGDVSSGDAVAGSTVVGSAGGGGVVSLSNSSEEDEATTGDTDLENELEGGVGPLAESAGGTTTTSQVGDNGFDLEQDNTVGSGDAVAGSEVVGVIGNLFEGFLGGQA